MKKIASIFCKILAICCIFTLDPGISSTKVMAMNEDKVMAMNEYPTLNEQRSGKVAHSIFAAAVDNDIAWLESMDYVKIYSGKDFLREKNLTYECYRKGSTTNKIINGKFNDLLAFVDQNSDGKENIYILANSTGLKLTTILWYLRSVAEKDWVQELNNLMQKFSDFGQKRLNGEARQSEINDIETIAQLVKNDTLSKA